MAATDSTDLLEQELAKLEEILREFRAVGVPAALLARRYELRKQLTASRGAGGAPKAGRVGMAFAIMPFREPFDSYYEEIFKPAASDAGYTITRSDEVYSPGAFVQTIWEEVLAADAIIAEMTGANANVLYELGLSHAVAKKVIMLTQRIEDVPSDLRHINCIVYDTTKVNWAEHTRNALQRMLLFEPAKPPKPLLDPPASVDNTALFNEVLGEVQELQERAASASDLAGRATEELESVRRDNASLSAALAGTIGESAGTTTTLYRENGAERARLLLPSGDQTLPFVHVPGGPFVFGFGSSAERTEVAGFWISQHSVTNAQFCAFLNAMGNQEEGGALWMDLDGRSPADRCRIVFSDGSFRVMEGFEEHPATYVNYYGAAAFCAWLGGELPTVEQWEKAVRGGDGREYPWGNSPPTPAVANIGDQGWLRDVPPIPVGEKPGGSSPFGVVQGIGNVWHWTRTYFPDRDVQAVRGGSFFDFRLGKREVYRFHVTPDGPDFSQGFLVVRRFITQSKTTTEGASDD